MQFPVRFWPTGFKAVALNEEGFKFLNGINGPDLAALSSLSSATARNQALNVIPSCLA